MSPRTAKYVAAMVREDNFDYNEWLNSVREEEAQAKQDRTAISSRELVAARAGNAIKVSDSRDAGPRMCRALSSIPALTPRALRRPTRQAKSQTPKARLTRWLDRVRSAWGEFQASRPRDAVYGYLEAVFAIVMHYKVRRRTKRLLRHAFKFAKLPFDKDAEPFSTIIRCTCGKTVDTKMISKWSRALRYVACSKKPDSRLPAFMKESGGVNACASLYAKQLGRNNRVAAI